MRQLDFWFVGQGRSDSSHSEYFVKKVFLDISQNSQENTCARVSFLIKRLWHRRFPVNFVKIFKTPFIQNISGRLLLKKGGWKIKLCFSSLKRHYIVNSIYRIRSSILEVNRHHWYLDFLQSIWFHQIKGCFKAACLKLTIETLEGSVKYVQVNTFF